MCPICAGFTENYGNVDGQDFLKCRSCGLIFAKKVHATRQSIYNADYIKARGYEVENTNIKNAKKLTFKNYLNKLLKLRPQKERLLEIGCSIGICLGIAKEMGWDIYGVDVSGEAVELARDYLGAKNIFVGDIRDIEFPQDYFSVVLLFDVLEHFPDPFKAVSIIQRILKPDGLCIIVTPNMSSISARLLKKRWPHFMAEHLFYFSPKTIRILLEKNGMHL